MAKESMASGYAGCGLQQSSLVRTATEIEGKIATTKADLAALAHALCECREETDGYEQRLLFLQNADTAREDFYEIRSLKDGEVRRIIINAEAEIIFDSEGKAVTVEDSRVPEFDEIDEKFAHVIPDTDEGRSYYRRLRCMSSHRRIPRDLPRDVRQQMKAEQEAAAQEEARQLRQIIVENFRELDVAERTAEIQEVLAQQDEVEQRQAQLCKQRQALDESLAVLQEQLAQARTQEEAVLAAKRKAEHDSRRQAWLDRLYPTAGQQSRAESSPLLPDCKEDHQEDDLQSEVSTELDDASLC